MTGDIKNVIVVGAGGSVGTVFVPTLVNSPHGYSVSTLSREQSSYTPPAGVRHIKTDYTHDSLVKALKGQDAVVSTVSGAGVLEQIKIIDAAIEAGVRRFIPSEYGGDTRNKYSHTRVIFFKMKSQVLEHLQANQDKIEWTGFGTGPFFDMTLKTGFLGFDIANTTVIEWDDKYKDSKFSTSRLSFVAEGVAESLSPSLAPKTANQYLLIREATISLMTLRAALEKATGSTWPINHIDLDADVVEGTAKLAAGDFSGVKPVIIGNLLDVRSESDFDAQGQVSNELLGLPTPNLQSIVDEIVAEVRASKE